MSYPARGRADFLELGDYNARCYECNGKYKASELLQHWQGYMVCQRCYEPRQPQDFVRGTQDVQTVPWSQNTVDAFVTGICTLAGRSATADYAIAGCAIVGYTPRNFTESLPTWTA